MIVRVWPTWHLIRLCVAPEPNKFDTTSLNKTFFACSIEQGIDWAYLHKRKKNHEAILQNDDKFGS